MQFRSGAPAHFDNVESCVEDVLTRVGKRVVLGLPVGLGKPNLFVNALVRRAVADGAIQLTIFTALSLRTPRWQGDLERRFLQPFVRRVFGDYPELEYVGLLERGKLPDNIRVNEFFLDPGAWLHNRHLQQHFVSSNYTQVVRDLTARGVNVIAQLVAAHPTDDGSVSLSCNPDLTVDLLPYVESMRMAGKPIALVGHLHPDLPYMYGDAVMPRTLFDCIVATPNDNAPLFCPPNMPIAAADYCIGLHAAALIRDGGTLQLGIGELGDAIVYALKLRHEQPEVFTDLAHASGTTVAHSTLIAQEGGTRPFAKGLYGCSEMLVDGFIDLYRGGILKRRVYPHALLQQLLDEERIDEHVDATTLHALAGAGLDRLSAQDFAALQTAGVFRDDVCYEGGNVVTADGGIFPAHLADSTTRGALARHCLGERLRNGVLAHGGFFLGPKAFYRALRELPEHERRQFAMQRISFVNELYGAEQHLKTAQRRFARFINTTMMVTGLGAAVSDGLADGHVVSGIGGQYNFVSMAQALPDARSLLCVRSTRNARGRAVSNIVWNYAYASIPRHLRDIVVTEYGIADLRGCSDSEVIERLTCIMDARFQDDFVARAKHSGKLRTDYRIPDRARSNTPKKLEDILRPYRRRGLFGALPFGGELTEGELLIASALKDLQTATRVGSVKIVARALFGARTTASMQPLLKRLQLDRPKSIGEHIQRRIVSAALHAVDAKL